MSLPGRLLSHIQFLKNPISNQTTSLTTQQLNIFKFTPLNLANDLAFYEDRCDEYSMSVYLYDAGKSPA